MITVKNLVKTYKKSEHNAVDDVTFEVQEGEFFAFLGPNGAGKTTTISILTTTLSKTSGVAKVAGFDAETEADKVRQNIGIIFQNPSLDLNLTAEENIRFHALLYNLYPFRPLYRLMDREYRLKVEELAGLIGIEDAIHKPVKTFSGGMKRKLEIIRSLMHSPKILFLDEPTTGLDPISRKNLWEYLIQVKENENTTIFLTTHYLEEAERADQVAIINKGKIAAAGTPRELKDKLVKEKLVLAAINNAELVAELKHIGVDHYVEEGRIVVNIENRSSHKLIKQIDTELTSLEIHAPTLEEAYLEIIEV